MESKDLIRTLYIIEQVSRGLDLSKIPSNIFTDIKEGECLFKLEEGLLEHTGIYYNHICRKNRTFDNVSEESLKDVEKEGLLKIEVSKDMFRDVACVLRKAKLVNYIGVDECFLDKDFMKSLETTRATWDYTESLDVPLTSLTTEATDKDFKTLMAVLGYPSEDAMKIYEHYKSSDQIKIKGFEKLTWKDNRLIIPLSSADKYDFKENDIKAIVISANPYDFFFCSYGNSFQSCFALNSSGGYKYFSGYVPKAATKEVFMVYATNGETVDVSLIPGHKIKIPQMYCRMWAYLDCKRYLMLDKVYGNHDKGDKVRHFLDTRFNAYTGEAGGLKKLYKGGAALQWTMKYATYYDSLRVSQSDTNDIMYKFACGSGHFYRGVRPQDLQWKERSNFASRCSTVTSIADDIDLSNMYLITSTGVLTQEKRCPMTNFLISSDETEHYLARYCRQPVKNALCFTYIDNLVYYSDESGLLCSDKHVCLYGDNEDKNFTRISDNVLFVSTVQGTRMYKPMPLKTIKEFLKGTVQKTIYDMFFLRIIEKDKITVLTYKNVKEKENESR